MIYFQCDGKAIYTAGLHTKAEKSGDNLIIRTYDKDGKELAKYEFEPHEAETLTIRRM